MGTYNTDQLQAMDRGHHLHPFTDTKALNAKGTRIITRGDGVYIWDSEGNRIIDGMAGLWCVNLGYNRKELVEAATAQMHELPYYNTFFQTSNAPSTQLAQMIAELTPGDLNHIFFANSGSEANDTVVRMVRHYWSLSGEPQRTVIISRKNAYHGSTVAASSLGGMEAMHKQGGALLPDVEHINQPYWYGEGGDLDEDAFGLKMARELEERILELGKERVAAFIGEPIQGAGGVIVPPATYWPEIQRICDQYGILLIADEVICGFGRTGEWFGSQTYGIRPDIMPMAKGLSSGYLPISAVAVGDRVASKLVEKGGEFAHGYTYSGHPVSAAVAIENIRILRGEGIVERVANDTGPYLQQRLRELEELPIVGKVDGVGLIAGMAMVKSKSPKTFFEEPGKVGGICRDHCFANGLIMRASGDRMLLSPPLVISRTEIDEIVDKARLCLEATARDVGLL